MNAAPAVALPRHQPRLRYPSTLRPSAPVPAQLAEDVAAAFGAPVVDRETLLTLAALLGERLFGEDSKTYAELASAVLRSFGHVTRVVHGVRRSTAGALHPRVWVEAHVRGQGWVGLDPKGQCLTDARYLCA